MLPTVQLLDRATYIGFASIAYVVALATAPVWIVIALVKYRPTWLEDRARKRLAEACASGRAAS